MGAFPAARRLAISLVAFLFCFWAVLAGAMAAASAAEYDGVVRPGDLVNFSIYYTYDSSCADSSPRPVTDQWYEDSSGNRIDGPAIDIRYSYGRTSATGGFYVDSGISGGYVAVDASVRYQCPDGTVRVIPYKLWRWKIESQAPPDDPNNEVPLPAQAVAGMAVVPVTGLAALVLGQRASLRRRGRQ